MNDEQKSMIEKFQCSGCICGMNTECEVFSLKEESETGFWCSGHSAGTFIMGVGKIALGLPKGFNKVGAIKTGFENDNDGTRRSTNIRLLITSPGYGGYNQLNVPVWAMEEDGYLFVRVMCPRVNYTYVDVIKGGVFDEVCPNAINVADFVDEID